MMISVQVSARREAELDFKTSIYPQKKSYVKDESGHVKRDSRGAPVYTLVCRRAELTATDNKGKTIKIQEVKIGANRTALLDTLQELLEAKKITLIEARKPLTTRQKIAIARCQSLDAAAAKLKSF